ncbi:MAG: hypothetical protein L6282_12480 [Candidatus Methanoperedenaceae archaeon]|nr:hypothetical protein [Candidatus Methanoperedenaceae archaeon]
MSERGRLDITGCGSEIITKEEIQIKEAYIVAIFSFDLGKEIDIKQTDFEGLFSAGGDTNLLKSYNVQSTRTFKTNFSNQFKRMNLPDTEIQIDNRYFFTKQLLTIHKTGIFILSLWITIKGSYGAGEIIEARNKLEHKDSIKIKSPYSGEYIPFTRYVNILAGKINRHATLNENIYTILFIKQSSISKQIDQVLSNISSYEWENRQLYGLITKNSIHRCRGVRLKEVEDIINSDIDFRKGVASWFKELNTTIIFSDFSHKYLNMRSEETDELIIDRFFHSTAHDVIIAELLVFQIALISRFTKNISNLLADSTNTYPKVMANARDEIITNMDNFSHVKILREYITGWARYINMKSVSGIDELKNDLWNKIEMLEKSIDGRYNAIIAEKNLKIQNSIFVIQAFVIFSMFYTILTSVMTNLKENMIQFIIAIILTIGVTIITMYLINKISSDTIK